MISICPNSAITRRTYHFCDNVLVCALLGESGEEVLGGNEHLGVLFEQLGEVLEQGVLWAEEIELIIALFAIHQRRQELTAIPRNELRCQSHLSMNLVKLINELMSALFPNSTSIH